MKSLHWLIMNHGPNLAVLLLVVFLGALPHRDTILGRIFLAAVGAAFLLTMLLGLKLSL